MSRSAEVEKYSSGGTSNVSVVFFSELSTLMIGGLLCGKQGGEILVLDADIMDGFQDRFDLLAVLWRNHEGRYGLVRNG